MACVNNALIVGGGIAGLSAAIVLSRQGIACDLVEITASGEPIGAAITITGPAIAALAAMGILESCRELGHVNPLSQDRFDAMGQPIELAGDRPPPSAIGMYRPVLAELLRAQARQHNVRLRYGTSVKSLTQQTDAVVATLSDGSVGKYDLVVGADGIRSAVRGLLFGAHLQPVHAGQTSVRWMAEGSPIVGPSMMYRAPTVYVLSYSLPRQNLTYVATVSDLDPGAHIDDSQAREVLRQQLACFSAPYIVELAKRLRPDSKVIVRPFEWLLVPDPWFQGRVLLIGDAAHATTAHLAAGGGMAMEDAVVLAECLATNLSVAASLQAFMRRRFGRVRLVVESGVAIIGLEHDGTSPHDIEAFRLDVLRQLAAPY